MRKLLYLALTAFVTILFNCGGNSSSTSTDSGMNDSISNQRESDSLASLIKTLDSIRNSGELVHFDIYKIGKLKGIEVSVQKVTVDTTVVSYINLRKDCGGEYYYSWEDAMIFANELPSLYSAANTIKSNIGRQVDHEERYTYLTKDDIAILSSCESGDKWTTRFSVDSHKSNSTVTLSSEELENMLDLINKAESKLKDIE